MIDLSTSRKRIRAWLCAALLTSVGVPVLGDHFKAVFRANGDGTGVEQVIPSNVAEGRGALTADQQHVYWWGGFYPSDLVPLAWIRRSGLDGNNVQDIVFGAIGDMKVDSQNAKLYFTPQSDCLPGCTLIARSNLDGSNVEYLFPAGFPEAIAVYPAEDFVCWSDIGFGDDTVPAIACGILGDPTGHVVVSETAEGLAIDPLHQKLYWTASDRIRRSNLDGSGIEDLVLGLDSPKGIVLDPLGNWMWWTERILGKIQRAHLDGSNVQDIVSGLDAPTGIGFVAAPAAGPNDKIYWVSSAPPENVPAASVRDLVALTLLLLTTSTAILLWRRRTTA